MPDVNSELSTDSKQKLVSDMKSWFLTPRSSCAPPLALPTRR